MKQVRLHGPNDVRIDDVPEPLPGPGDAVVEVQACGICGTDLGFIAIGGLAGPTDAPMPLGHELSGVVTAVGDSVVSVNVGDRVALNPSDPTGGAPIGNGAPQGGFTPHLLVTGVDAGRLHRLPDDLAFDIAALAEPLGVGMNAVDKVDAQPGEKAVVFGAGPIGLTAIVALRTRGVEDIVAVDRSRLRLEIAESLGAATTVEAGRPGVWRAIRAAHGETELMGGPVTDTDIFVEASGADEVIAAVVGRAKRHARLTIVALHRSPIEISFLDVLMRELRISGAMEYPQDFARTIDALAHQDLSPMITHRYPLDRFHDALEVARDPAVAGKVIVEMS